MKRKRSKTEIVTALLVRVVLWLLNSYLAMLLVGAAHSTDHRVPALGYDTTFFLVLALSSVITTSTRDAIEDAK